MAIDLNAIRNELNRISSKGQPNTNYLENFVPMPEGEGSIILRLLPPTPNQILPFFSTRVHRVNGKNIHCPMTLVGDRWQGNCPVCNECRALWKQSENGCPKDEADELQDEYRRIKANERYYWNVVVRKIVTPKEILTNVGPKIWSVGKKMQQKLLRAWEGDSKLSLPGLGDFTDLTTGRDIVVVKRIVKGAGNFTYPDIWTESTFLAPSVAGSQAEMDKWMESLHDLSSLRKVLPLNEISMALRYHKGQETDPNEGYNKDSIDIDTDDVPAPRQAVKPVMQVPTQQKPKAPVHDDQDEAQFEQDFLARLKGM